jgi:hypothetical protein
MIHDKQWFEMSDQRKPRLAQASWVPLYGRRVSSELQYPEPGHWEEYFGAVAIAFPAESVQAIDEIEWTNAFRNGMRPRVEDGEFFSAKQFVDWHSEFEGGYLVLRGWFETGDHDEIIIDADLILGLQLLQEEDTWVAPYEDYAPVIRVHRDANRRIVLIEIRAEQLRDYLCARNCGLLVSTYRSRREVSPDPPQFEMPSEWKDVGTRWEGHISEIAASGAAYGSGVAIITVGRTDVDPQDDVPEVDFPSEGNTWSSNQEYVRMGPKRYRISGEMWRNEWIEPGPKSLRIRGDREQSAVEFIIDAGGSRVKAHDFSELPARWLWFAPGIVNELLSHRGTNLIWYTEFTGGLQLPAEGIVHFGVNDAGLINVYAKDIGELRPLWQKYWSTFNVTPDGKVARELLASQMECRPADTFAPESLLESAIDLLDERFSQKYGQPLFREHVAEAVIRQRAHRFLAVDEYGFYRLMKELTRLCVERLDMTLLKKLTSDADKNLASLKRLERLLDKCGISGREAVRELVGIYELRHLDSHLPTSDIEDAFKLLRLDVSQSWMRKGKQAIANVAGALRRIADAIKP